MRKFIIFITAVSLLIIILALHNSAKRQDGVLTEENTIVLPDEPEVPVTPSVKKPESTIISDYAIQNADEYITLKTWGSNFTEQEKKDDTVSVFTYANNIAVQYNISPGEEDILKTLSDVIETDKKTKKDYKYTVGSVYENKNTVWTTTEFEKDGEKGGSIIFVRQLNQNVVTGNISYFIDYPRVTYIAKPELVDTFVKACGLTGGATINLESPDYLLYKVKDIPVTAYSWKEDQTVDERSQNGFVASFRSGAKGVNESVEIWKGNVNAYQEVKNYLISAMQHNGIWFSHIDDNENFSYVILHYNIADGLYDTVIYLVENEYNHYKTVVITAEKDCEKERLQDIMEAYGIEDRPTIYSLDELKKLSSVFKETTKSFWNVLSDEERIEQIAPYSNLLTKDKINSDLMKNGNGRKKNLMKETLMGQLIVPEEKTFTIRKLKSPTMVTLEIGLDNYKESEMKMKVKG